MEFKTKNLYCYNSDICFIVPWFTIDLKVFWRNNCLKFLFSFYILVGCSTIEYMFKLILKIFLIKQI